MEGGHVWLRSQGPTCTATREESTGLIGAVPIINPFIAGTADTVQFEPVLAQQIEHEFLEAGRAEPMQPGRFRGVR